MDPTHAYPGNDLKGWRRHIILEKPLITVVMDEVSSAKGAEIETRFHSEVKQVPKDNYLLLDDDLGDMALIPVTDGKFTFRPGKHAVLAVQKNANFAWIPYCGTVLKAADEKTIIFSIILPVKDDAEAIAVSKSAKQTRDGSGNVTLAFTAGGKNYSYKFTNTKDGFVLE